MKVNTYIGCDNGSTGSIGVITENDYFFVETPVKKVKSYQKTKDRFVNRIDWLTLYKTLEPFKENAFVLLERPLVNPGRFQATASALRAYESTLVVLEYSGFEYDHCDSKAWQKFYLGENIKGSKFLKQASMIEGIKRFPKCEDLIKHHGDADGLFISLWLKEHFKENIK